MPRIKYLEYYKMSEATQKIYVSILNQLTKAIGEDLTQESMTRKWQNIVNFIESKPAIPTRKNYYSFIMKVSNDFTTDEVHKKAEERYKVYKCAIQDKCLSQQPTEKEKEGILTPEQIQQRIEYLHEKIPNSIDNYTDYVAVLKYIVLLFYSEFPLRNDLPTTKLFFESDYKKSGLVEVINELVEQKQNYILITDKKTELLTPSFICLFNYKTAYKYGDKRISLSPSLVNVFKKYQNVLTEYSKDNFFIINADGNPMTQNNFTKFFNKIFDNKAISTTMMRKAAVSDLYKAESGKLQKKKNLAYIMGHDMNTAETYYSKVLQ